MDNLDRSRLIARLFSRPVLEDIARRGDASKVGRQLKSLGVVARGPTTVSDLLDASLADIEATYRCEYVYKAAIASRIIFGRHSPRTASLAIELQVAGSIVDAAVFNGTSSAYEIKTEFDSSRRLRSQTPAYLRAFDRVYLVTHPNLVERYARVVDQRIGILALTGRSSLSQVRAAVSDVGRIEPAVVFRMMRRHEYMDAVESHYGSQPRLPNGLIDGHYRELFLQLTSDQAHTALVAAMRSRTVDAETVDFLSAVPVSLRALAFATPLSRPQRQRVLAALAAKL